MSLVLKDDEVGSAIMQIDEIDHAIVMLLSGLVRPWDTSNAETILNELAEIASSSHALRSILNNGDPVEEPDSGEPSEISAMASALASRRAPQ